MHTLKPPMFPVVEVPTTCALSKVFAHGRSRIQYNLPTGRGVCGNVVHPRPGLTDVEVPEMA